jgi:hypothetical protein
MGDFMEHNGEKHRQSPDGDLSNGFFQYLLGREIYHYEYGKPWQKTSCARFR